MEGAVEHLFGGVLQYLVLSNGCGEYQENLTVYLQGQFRLFVWLMLP
jgi:hypothetical protein